MFSSSSFFLGGIRLIGDNFECVSSSYPSGSFERDKKDIFGREKGSKKDFSKISSPGLCDEESFSSKVLYINIVIVNT